MDFEVIAYFLLPAVFALTNEIKVLHRVTCSDDELIRVAFRQLGGRYVQGQVTLFTVLRLHIERVLHCHVQSDERSECFGERHIADVVRRAGTGFVVRHIAYKTNHLITTVSAYPGRVTAERRDSVLTGISVRQSDGLEMISHPR